MLLDPLSDEIFRSCMDALKQMQKKETVDYNKIYSLITNLQKIGKLDETTAILFELLLKENFKSCAAIGELNAANTDKCLVCKHDQFRNYSVNILPREGTYNIILQ